MWASDCIVSTRDHDKVKTGCEGFTASTINTGGSPGDHTQLLIVNRHRPSTQCSPTVDNLTINATTTDFFSNGRTLTLFIHPKIARRLGELLVKFAEDNKE